MIDPGIEDQFRDLEAMAVVHDVSTSTLEAIGVWPVHPDHPAMVHLFTLVNRWGPYGPLAVALGWAAHEIRHALAIPCGTPVSGDVRLEYDVHDVDLMTLVHRLLGYAMNGNADGWIRLHEAATMLRHDGEETTRVIVGVLDLCAGLRAGTCDVGFPW